MRTTFADREIRIADLVTADRSQVDRKTFERCTFLGPALVAFQRGIQENVVFDVQGDPPEKVTWEVPAGRSALGIVIFDTCVIRDCSFKATAVVGTRENLDPLRREMRPYSERPLPK